MRTLILIWERRAAKYKSLADKSFNEFVIEGLRAYSDYASFAKEELYE